MTKIRVVICLMILIPLYGKKRVSKKVYNDLLNVSSSMKKSSSVDNKEKEKISFNASDDDINKKLFEKIIEQSMSSMDKDVESLLDTVSITGQSVQSELSKESIKDHAIQVRNFPFGDMRALLETLGIIGQMIKENKIEDSKLLPTFDKMLNIVLHMMRANAYSLNTQTARELIESLDPKNFKYVINAYVAPNKEGIAHTSIVSTRFRYINGRFSAGEHVNIAVEKMHGLLLEQSQDVSKKAAFDQHLMDTYHDVLVETLKTILEQAKSTTKSKKSKKSKSKKKSIQKKSKSKSKKRRADDE